MAPHEVNLDALSDALNQDKIAFGTENPNNVQLVADLSRAIDNVESTGLGPVGEVVLETTPSRTGDLRDIAQDLKNMTELDTVVVRTPHSTAAVSDSLTRAQIEKGQFALISEPDYAAGLEAFAAEAGETSYSWALVAVLSLALIGATAAGAWFTSGRPQN